jgi:hypothetical protein
MTEVKIREDEYDLIKNIAGRIQGLPSSVQLARRERRLLTEGLLQRTEIKDHTRESIHAYSTSNVSILHDRSGDRLSASKPQTVVLDTLKRSSRLVDAINNWDTRRGRSGSVKSTASSGTGVSFKSYGTSSTGTSNLPLTPLSAHFPSRCGVISPSQISPPDSPYARSISRGPPRSKHPLSGFPSPESNETLGPVPVQVFVFTDLMLLATPDSERQNGETREWCLLEDIGMSRILGVTEYSDEDSAGTCSFSCFPNELYLMNVSSFASNNSRHSSRRYQELGPRRHPTKCFRQDYLPNHSEGTFQDTFRKGFSRRDTTNMAFRFPTVFSIHPAVVVASIPLRRISCPGPQCRLGIRY